GSAPQEQFRGVPTRPPTYGNALWRIARGCGRASAPSPPPGPRRRRHGEPEPRGRKPPRSLQLGPERRGPCLRSRGRIARRTLRVLPTGCAGQADRRRIAIREGLVSHRRPDREPAPRPNLLREPDDGEKTPVQTSIADG